MSVVDHLVTSEQRAFAASIRRWSDEQFPKPAVLALERKEHVYPDELFDKLGAAGYQGVGISEEFGGSGGTVTDQAILMRGLARNLGGLAWIWGINAFAGSKSIGLYGTPEQRQRLLPDLAQGRLKFAIAVTEPDGGTDVIGAMTSSATRTDGGWLINARKTWSTQSHVADYILLLARTQQPADSRKRHHGLTLFLVPGGAPGLSARPLPKLGMRCLSSCDLFLDDVFVPDDLVLGEPGNGWSHLIKTLNVERLMIAAMSLGMLDGVIEESVAYAKQRIAFGGPIGRFQSIQHYLADMFIDRAAAELLVWSAGKLTSDGEAFGVGANVAKVFAAEAAVRAADLGIQIMGGAGYSAETQMQRYWRDARLYNLAPISNEMARNSIAEHLGMPRSY